MKRRDFLKAAVAAPLVLPHAAFAAAPDAAALPKFGNARIIHLTDTHAQLAPALYREPSANIGVGAARGKPPHLVGTAFLDRWKIAPGSREAYAFACLDFDALAKRYGKMGGFDRLATIVKRLRADAPRGDAMLVDGGDLMQGSGLAKLTAGADMIAAANLLGVEALTGHWEFTYGQDRLRAALKEFKGTFVAQNVFLTEDAAFNGAEAFDQASGRVFPPYVVRSFGDRRVGLIGQAFPYVPVAHPKRFTPDWTFGLRETELKALVEVLRTKEKVDAVVLLSHDGMDVDLKLASRVPGLDVVLGGHTHDATPAPVAVANSGGTTHVVNGGCNGKFVGSLDLDLAPGKLAGLRYRLLPVFADLVAPDAEMAALVGKLRAPHAALLDAPLATPGRALWRRGNFDGPTDDAICVALLEGLDCQIALSPGFRWGTTLAAGEPARMEDL
ncbi:MAG: thiosulfohydrolase SoxB, partial [Hyphomicrobiales bacterium]|nr:thiosulfohydrolase SoxB [Hyphomicrobiales bacterium]